MLVVSVTHPSFCILLANSVQLEPPSGINKVSDKTEISKITQDILHIFDPLGPKSDQHQFSLNKISNPSRVKVRRIT